MNKLIFKFTVINHIHGSILIPVNAIVNHIYESFFCNWTSFLIQKVNVSLFFLGIQQNIWKNYPLEHLLPKCYQANEILGYLLRKLLWEYI